MNIRKYKKADLIQVAKLIQKTYSKYNKDEGDSIAIKNYLNFYSTNKDNLLKLKEKFSKTP